MKIQAQLTAGLIEKDQFYEIREFTGTEFFITLCNEQKYVGIYSITSMTKIFDNETLAMLILKGKFKNES